MWKITKITIPSKTEIIHPIYLKICEDSLILNKESSEGVFVANTILPHKGICHVKLLNGKVSEITLLHSEVDLVPQKNYRKNRIRNNFSNGSNRFEKLLKSL